MTCPVLLANGRDPRAWFGQIPTWCGGDGPTPVSLFLLVISARRLGQRMQNMEMGQ